MPPTRPSRSTSTGRREASSPLRWHQSPAAERLPHPRVPGGASPSQARAFEQKVVIDVSSWFGAEPRRGFLGLVVGQATRQAPRSRSSNCTLSRSAALAEAPALTIVRRRMADYIYTMYRADKFYGPERQVLANISLSFLPGAKIGVLGPNGAGKSTLLRIMAGKDEPSSGVAELAPGATAGLLEQEPELDPAKDVREQRRGRRPRDARPARPLQRDQRRVRRAGRRLRHASRRAGEGAGQDRPRRRVGSSTTSSTTRWTRSAAPTPTATSRRSRAASAAASRSAGCCSPRPTCSSSTSRRTTSTPSRSSGSSASSPTTRAPSSPSRTTATSSTTSPAGSSSSTAARASRSRATTRRGSSRSRTRLAHRGEDGVGAPAHARARARVGARRARRRGTRRRRRASARTRSCSPRSRTSSSTASRSTSRPARASATS